MGLKITVLTLEDSNGVEAPHGYVVEATGALAAAVSRDRLFEIAEREKLRVIENEYEWTDSGMLDDFGGSQHDA